MNLEIVDSYGDRVAIKRNDLKTLERQLEDLEDQAEFFKKQCDRFGDESINLERQLAEARENIYKYAEIAMMEAKDEFGYSWEDFKLYVLDDELKEKVK